MEDDEGVLRHGDLERLGQKVKFPLHCGGEQVDIPGISSPSSSNSHGEERTILAAVCAEAAVSAAIP